MKPKELTRPVILLAGLLALGLLLPSGPAYAAVFNLDNWNVIELNNTDDFVQVSTGGDCTGGNTICVQWKDGVNEGDPSAIGVDMFFYDVDGTADGDAVPTILSISGNTDTWSFNFNGDQADSFGSFDSHKSSGSSEDGGVLSALVFTLSGSVAALDEFAVHVRYSEECSGFASNRQGTPESEAACGVSVPEPSSLALLGFGLIGVAVTRRRWATTKV